MRLVAACAVLLTCLGAGPGHADKRVALVIGNGAYWQAPALINPKNDAADVGRSLQALGFELIVATDLDRSGMNDALDRFSHRVSDAEIALVYYSGHTMQYGGRNSRRAQVLAAVNECDRLAASKLDPMRPV